MIKVLGLALYGPLAASTRYRLGQYVPGLASMGIELTVVHLLGDDYLRRRFSGGSLPLATIVRDVLLRMSDLVRLKRYDLAIVYCELFPLMPSWLEIALMGKPYIYDFDDAFYLKYRNLGVGAIQPLLDRKFENMIHCAHAVTAGNNVLGRFALRFNPKTLILPTVVDTHRFLPCRLLDSSDYFTIGWIGSPSTSRYLSQLALPLSELGREGPVRFLVVGGSAPPIPNVDVIEVAWREDTEVELLNQFDVGVMPLPDDDWARGKCAFKLIQYMACGVAVVASPVGANVDVVSSDCGFLASTSEEWLRALRELRDNPAGRRRLGERGRDRVVAKYSLACNLPQMASLIREATNQ